MMSTEPAGRLQSVDAFAQIRPFAQGRKDSFEKKLVTGMQ